MVFTNGCFDWLHVAHLALLRKAAAEGDLLIEGLNGDQSVRELKGADRPLIPEAERASLVATLD